MPILIALVSAFAGGIVYWLVRLDGHLVVHSMFSAAARERRMRRSLDAEARAAARSVGEPRDAALALMIRIGSVDGALLPAAESVVDHAGREIFGYGAKLTEHRTYAEYVSRNTPSFSVLFREVTPLLREKLSADERTELVGLLEKVAEAAGGLTQARSEMIEEVRAKLLPPRRGA